MAKSRKDISQAKLKYVRDQLVFINLCILCVIAREFLFASLSACRLLLVT